VKNGGLANVDEPEFYTLKRTRDPESFGPHHTFAAVVTACLALAGMIRTEMARLDPLAPVEIRPLAQQLSDLRTGRVLKLRCWLFALCGTVMAVIGLYGVIAYAASQRTQEIGVRMALGATRADILRLIAAKGCGSWVSASWLDLARLWGWRGWCGRFSFRWTRTIRWSMERRRTAGAGGSAQR